MVEIRDNTADDIPFMRELAKQKHAGMGYGYDQSAQKIILMKDGKRVGFVQLKAALFIDGIYLNGEETFDKLVTIRESAGLIVEQAKESKMKLLWASKKEFERKGDTGRHVMEYFNRIFASVGHKINYRKYNVWETR